MGYNDIKYLKLKLEQYLLNEDYEKAATIKKWIDELEEKLSVNQKQKIKKDG